MPIFLQILLAASNLSPVHRETPPALHTIAQLYDETYRYNRPKMPFDIQCRVLATTTDAPRPPLSVEDSTGRTLIRPHMSLTNLSVRAGDLVRICGRTAKSNLDNTFAECLSITVVDSGQPPATNNVSIHDLLTGTHDFLPIRTQGTIIDAITDEIDVRYVFLILKEANEKICVSVQSTAIRSGQLQRWIGGIATVTGITTPHDLGFRKYLGRTIQAFHPDGLTISNISKSNNFDFPVLEDLRCDQPERISALGRRSVKGHVIAVWQKRNILLETLSGQPMRVELDMEHPPDFGDTIEVVGLPETDLYWINMSRAFWRSCKIPPMTVQDTPLPHEAVKNADPLQLARHHGHTLQIRGTIGNLPVSENDKGLVYLKTAEGIWTVDASSVPHAINGIRTGCELAVSGTYVVETENWRPSAIFPRIKGSRLVIRKPTDVKVVRWPSWWTPTRLRSGLLVLLVILGGFLVWISSLKKLAAKRGAELFAQKIDLVESELKLIERTRLAVELHDSLSQTLSGVSMQLDTAANISFSNPTAAFRLLDIARKILKSCRDELRNCLWDLRSDALEESDMNTAIRRTLDPFVDNVTLHVRFQVERARLTDNTTHAILRIIRELVANAIRHGSATTIHIAGSIEDDRLLFSVKDNGTGFDTTKLPGLEDGHFGLQGIRERIEDMQGSIAIESTPGTGCKVTMSVHAPHMENE